MTATKIKANGGLDQLFDSPQAALAPSTLGRVIVCEADEATRELLVENLRADRYEVVAAADGCAALRLCRYWSADLLLLDTELEDCKGLDVVRAIRSGGPGSFVVDRELPVIVLSRLADAEDRVRGLRSGADDYVIKPFSYTELLLRIALRLRTSAADAKSTVRVADILIDPDTRQTWVAGDRVDLSRKEFDLLRMLATEPRRVFTKAELLQAVWGAENFGKSRTLESHASRLRRKLDPDGGSYVQNCWGVGYRLFR